MGLTIAGVARDGELKRETLKHLSTYGPEPDLLDMETIGGATQPPDRAEVTYTMPDGTLLFGGILTGAPETKAGFMAMRYGIQCGDWRLLADKLPLNERLQAMTAGQMIKVLVAKYAPWLDVANVDEGGRLFPSVKFTRNMYLTDALKKLSDLTGWVWDIDPEQRLWWGPPGAIPAPFGLFDGSLNFEHLVVDRNSNQLRNRVLVFGGWEPEPKATPFHFTQEATGLNTHFPLPGVPYGLDAYEVFKPEFTSGIGAEWLETDTINNTDPTAGHIPADGYLFTTIQQGAALAESGWLQVVGGSGVWGAERLMSYAPIERGDGRRFEWEVSFTSAVGEGRIGLWDPNTQGALAGELYGFFFDDGVIRPSIGGVVQGATTATYTTNKSARFRILPKVAGGAKLQVNLDDTGDTGLPADERISFRASQWVTLLDTNSGNAGLFTFAGWFGKNAHVRVRRCRVFNRLYGMSLTVGGVEKVLGLLGVDEGSGCDALVGLQAGDSPVLAFFGDTRPAAGTQGVFTFFRRRRVFAQRQDSASVAALAALETNPAIPAEHRGVFAFTVTDESLTTREMCFLRAKQELEQFANPIINITFETTRMGLRAGQLLSVGLTQALSGRDLQGSFLIQRVETISEGSGNFRAFVTASSRLKGIQDYLAELLLAGKKAELSEDDNTPLEEVAFASDTFDFTDNFDIEEGLNGPFYYLETLLLEDGSGSLLFEDGSEIDVTDGEVLTSGFGEWEEDD